MSEISASFKTTEAVYQKLPDGEFIRYMILEPGQKDDPLICTLLVSRVAEMPFFEAISYVWGSDERKNDIRCNGAMVKITDNLRDALMQQRRVDNPRTLWADSICINQDDMAERGHQVLLMGKIYRGANQVLVFIGPDNNGDGPAAKSLILELDSMVSKGIRDTGAQPGRFPYPDQQLRSRILNDKRWASFSVLLEKPWFKRGWVVQEVGLSSNAVLSWGEEIMSWHTIVRVWDWICYRLPEFHTRYSCRIPDVYFVINRIRYTDEFVPFVDSVADHTKADFLELLDGSRELAVKDPRDRVYAFLAFTQESGLNLQVQPDYMRSYMEIYLDLAHKWIAATQDTNLVKYVQHTSETIEDEFPSWVPRWNVNLFGPLGTVRKFLPESPAEPTAVVSTASGHSVLKVRSLLFGRVEFASTMLSKSSSPSEVHSVWDAVSRLDLECPYPSTHRCMAFLQILTASIYYGDFLEWLRCRETYSHYLTAGTADSDDEAVDRLAFYHRMIQDYINNRKVIVTDRGYYGLTPGITSDGDICALIFGASTPFILRRSHFPGHYKIVGEAYIPSKVAYSDVDVREGMLDFGASRGEDWLEWGAKEQDIYLC
jgi:hypothetical protein